MMRERQIDILEGEESEPSRGLAARMNIRWPVIALGALLIPFNCQWIIVMERVMFGPYPSTVSLFANVVFALFLLVALNRLLVRFAPRLAFSQGELLTVYTMLAVSTGLAGLDGVSTISQLIPHGVFFASGVNGWGDFLHYFPSWLIVGNKSIASGHFLGHSTFYSPEVFRAWAIPIAAWTLFVCTLLLVANCLNVLVRAQWSERERLTFPIISLPLQMTEDGVGKGFFGNRVMWLGFALAGGMNFWNGLAMFVPTMPSIPLGIWDLHQYFVEKPWSAIAWMPLTFYPFVIGLGFLLPLDLVFSCVFFFLFWKAQVLVSSAMAWDGAPDFPFIPEQGFGSIVGLFVFYAWSGRRHYAEIWKRAVRGVKTVDDEREALSPRAALTTAGIGIVFLVLFGRLAGAEWWLAVGFVAIYLMTIMVVARIRAELGPPVHDFHYMGANYMIPRALGAHDLTGQDLAFLTLTSGISRAHRADTTPIGLEGLQMAHLARFSARRMFAAIMIATVIGCVSTLWSYEHLAYHLGASVHFMSGTGAADEAYTRMQGWSEGSLEPAGSRMGVIAMIVGFVCTLVLFALRLTIVGFPLHPIGYAVSSSWAIHLIWFPLLIAGIVKWLIMRYGGFSIYRKAVPFFLGLILGDCVIGSAWGILGLYLGTPTYNFFGK